jgi:hypothetical protein
MIFDTAAAISGVRPGRQARRLCRRSLSSQSRRPPTVRWLTGAKACGSAVDDQPGDFIVFVGDQRFAEEVLERDIGQGHLRGDPFAVVAGGHPGQVVPERAGLALAMTS